MSGRLIGLKRMLAIFMMVLIPLGSAEPISLLQDSPLYILPPPVVHLPQPPPAPPEPVFTGVASWYSESDPYINLRTANGEIFDDQKMTCASWGFSFKTRLKVTNVANGRSVICTVNDRGPAKRLHRLIDLTLGAFRRIADPRSGLIHVEVTEVSGGLGGEI